MKLMVRFGDHHSAAIAMEHTNQQWPVNYRIVVIELTPEQAAMLEPRPVGNRGALQLLETREVIALED